mmetsp:Transcript_19693/g.61980  ORF Transcript_19693/g.61980 Transcript_19693/m.61980 type:complete len:409 (+) Transcript_19693:183-1409(+)
MRRLASRRASRKSTWCGERGRRMGLGSAGVLDGLQRVPALAVDRAVVLVSIGGASRGGDADRVGVRRGGAEADRARVARDRRERAVPRAPRAQGRAQGELQVLEQAFGAVPLADARLAPAVPRRGAGRRRPPRPGPAADAADHHGRRPRPLEAARRAALALRRLGQAEGFGQRPSRARRPPRVRRQRPTRRPGVRHRGRLGQRRDPEREALLEGLRQIDRLRPRRALHPDRRRRRRRPLLGRAALPRPGHRRQADRPRLARGHAPRPLAVSVPPRRDVRLRHGLRKPLPPSRPDSQPHGLQRRGRRRGMGLGRLDQAHRGLRRRRPRDAPRQPPAPSRGQPIHQLGPPPRPRRARRPPLLPELPHRRTQVRQALRPARRLLLRAGPLRIRPGQDHRRPRRLLRPRRPG